MRVLCKIWLYHDGKAFGEGPYNLLKHIEESGSLNKAARIMGISYKKAWTIINRCESRLGFKLLEKKKGGKSGGGSSVTERAKSFLKNYEDFREEVKDFAEKAFHRHFGENLLNEKKD